MLRSLSFFSSPSFCFIFQYFLAGWFFFQNRVYKKLRDRLLASRLRFWKRYPSNLWYKTPRRCFQLFSNRSTSFSRSTLMSFNSVLDVGRFSWSTLSTEWNSICAVKARVQFYTHYFSVNYYLKPETFSRLLSFLNPCPKRLKQSTK